MDIQYSKEGSRRGGHTIFKKINEEKKPGWTFNIERREATEVDIEYCKEGSSRGGRTIF